MRGALGRVVHRKNDREHYGGQRRHHSRGFLFLFLLLFYYYGVGVGVDCGFAFFPLSSLLLVPDEDARRVSLIPGTSIYPARKHLTRVFQALHHHRLRV